MHRSIKLVYLWFNVNWPVSIHSCNNELTNKFNVKIMFVTNKKELHAEIYLIINNKYVKINYILL